MSAVARIYRPGCKVDHVLVLEGPQGRQKSEALRMLAKNDSWFTDRLSHVASKDAVLEIAGVLIVEIAEMDALTKATSSAQKSFLTRRRDRFLPPYGKHPINLPRQCVFAATINPTVGGYLKDPTGARRFWPVACRGMIDRDGLEKVRDQLWAEAVHQFKAGAPGGLRRRNSKHSRPSSKLLVSSSMPGRNPSANGWETASTSVPGRCSNMHSASPPSIGRSPPRSESSLS